MNDSDFWIIESVDEPLDEKPSLNGMYYETSSDKYVSFVLGRRHYEVAAKHCGFDKSRQVRTKRERSI